ncbi:hypothetical protein DFH28DRAFT_938561 [Melampsora americana]|nr:hypothetical protein DFH28DRAFT_938561 [Melampsora americana]
MIQAIKKAEELKKEKKLKEIEQADRRRIRAESRIPTNNENIIITTQEKAEQSSLEEVQCEGEQEVTREKHTPNGLDDPGNYGGSEKDSDESDTNSDSEDEEESAIPGDRETSKKRMKEESVKMDKMDKEPGLSGAGGRSQRLYGLLVEKDQRIGHEVERERPPKHQSRDKSLMDRLVEAIKSKDLKSIKRLREEMDDLENRKGTLVETKEKRKKLRKRKEGEEKKMLISSIDVKEK